MFYQYFLFATLCCHSIITAERSFVKDDDDYVEKDDDDNHLSSSNCKLSNNGSYGNNAALDVEIVSFRYDLELNVPTSSETNKGTVEQDVIPAVETQLSSLLLPVLFQECKSTGISSILLFSEHIQGLSSQPKDKMSSGGCVKEGSNGTVCYAIDAAFSLYIDSSRNRQLMQQQETKSNLSTKIIDIIKNKMMEGKLNSAHTDISSITFVDLNAVSLDIDDNESSRLDIDDNESSRLDIDDNESSRRLLQWWQAVSIIVGVSSITVSILYVWNRRKATKEELFDDVEFKDPSASIA